MARKRLLTSLRARRWAALGVLVVVCAALGWWWWSRQPKALVVMAKYPSAFYSLPFDTGYVILGVDGHCTAYDWEGRQQWTLHASTRPFASISPDGAHFITYEQYPGGVALAGWQHGKPYWRQVLPATEQQGFPLRIEFVDAQRVIITMRHGQRRTRRTAVYLLNKGRIEAKTMLPGFWYAMPGGRMLALPLRKVVYAWSVDTHHLRLAYHHAYTDPFDAPAGWKTDGWSPNWRYVGYSQEASATRQRIRIVDTVTKAYWEFPLTGHGTGGMIISNNGQFAAVSYSQPILPAHIERLRDEYSLLHNQPSQRNIIAIYERPGILRARIVRTGTSAKVGEPLRDGLFLNPYDTGFSPDGRRIIGSGNSTYLLRW